MNVLVKDTGLIEDDILRNAATSVRSIIEPWSDYVCRHEYGSVRVCEKPITLSSSMGKLSFPILKWYEHVALCKEAVQVLHVNMLSSHKVVRRRINL